jgi:hypothetical protein
VVPVEISGFSHFFGSDQQDRLPACGVKVSNIGRNAELALWAWQLPKSGGRRLFIAARFWNSLVLPNKKGD